MPKASNCVKSNVLNARNTWEGIAYCDCGTVFFLQKKYRRLTKERYDVLTISVFAVYKGANRGAGITYNQVREKYNQVREAVKKAKKKGYESMLDRFLNQESYRNSQIDVGLTGNFCKLFDALGSQETPQLQFNHVPAVVKHWQNYVK